MGEMSYSWTKPSLILSKENGWVSSNYTENTERSAMFLFNVFSFCVLNIGLVIFSSFCVSLIMARVFSFTR